MRTERSLRYEDALANIARQLFELHSSSELFITEFSKASTANIKLLVRLFDRVMIHSLESPLPDPNDASNMISGRLPGYTDRIYKNRFRGQYSHSWISNTVAWRILSISLGNAVGRVSPLAETILFFTADQSLKSILYPQQFECQCSASLIPLQARVKSLEQLLITQHLQTRHALIGLGIDPNKLEPPP